MSDKWQHRFLDLAKLVSTWSKDPSTKVGCIIADENNRVVSLGFNGLPHGVHDSDDRLQDRETKLRIIIHAEENALLFAGRPVSGCTAYVWPLLPCASCASKLIQSGISVVVAPKGGPTHWREENNLGLKMLKEAGIDVVVAGGACRNEPRSAPDNMPFSTVVNMAETQSAWAKRWGQEEL